MRNYKIPPAAYKTAVRIAKWNHGIWNRNGCGAKPDAFARQIIADAAEEGFPVRYEMFRSLDADFRASGRKAAELREALDAVQRNKSKRRPTPHADRRRNHEWLNDMDWYNNRRYDNPHTKETWAQICAYYLGELRDNTPKDAKELFRLAERLSDARAERKRELAARMNAPEGVTQGLIYSATGDLPF